MNESPQPLQPAAVAGLPPARVILGLLPATLSSRGDGEAFCPIASPEMPAPFAALALVDPLATVDPLAAVHRLAAVCAKIPRIIIMSGPLGPTDADNPSRAWMPASRRAFGVFCDALEAAAPNHALVIWPHAAGVISDSPSLLSFLRERAGRPMGGTDKGGSPNAMGWRFVFDPAAMLTPAMMPEATEHLTRLFDSLASHPDAIAIVDDPGLQSRHPGLWERCSLPRFVREVP